MKKIILMILSFVIAVSTVAFTGCKKDNNNESVLEIAVNIGGYGSDGFKAIARKFEEEHKGTEVNVNDVYAAVLYGVGLFLCENVAFFA